MGFKSDPMRYQTYVVLLYPLLAKRALPGYYVRVATKSYKIFLENVTLKWLQYPSYPPSKIDFQASCLQLDGRLDPLCFRMMWSTWTSPVSPLRAFLAGGSSPEVSSPHEWTVIFLVGFPLLVPHLSIFCTTSSSLAKFCRGKGPNQKQWWLGKNTPLLKYYDSNFGYLMLKLFRVFFHSLHWSKAS